MCCVCAVRFWSGTGRASSECFRSRDLILYLGTERVSLYPAKRRCARSSMDRASDYGSEGWGFESLRARSGPPRCDPPVGALHFLRHPCGGAFSFSGPFPWRDAALSDETGVAPVLAPVWRIETRAAPAGRKTLNCGSCARAGAMRVSNMRARGRARQAIERTRANVFKPASARPCWAGAGFASP